jgi:transposase-like protein
MSKNACIGSLLVNLTRMANKTNRTGKRYSAQEKQEIIDSVHRHNSEHGRGGATAAAAKHGVSTLTISNWMKAAGASATPRKKKESKSKTSAASNEDKSSGNISGGVSGRRYTPEEKNEVIDFVHQFNSENGRGGATAAANKYGVSMLTISNWMKAAGSPAKPGRKVKGAKSSGRSANPQKATKTTASTGDSDFSGRVSVLNRLAALDRQIASTRKELEVLEAEFQKAKASL